MEKKFSDMLEKSLVDMPDAFSAVQLSKAAKALGFPQILISTGRFNAWLSQRCNQTSRFMWSKRYVQPSPPRSSVPLDQDDDAFLEECIKYLKDRGYKVMEQVFVDC